jgi:CRP-like cAMP-binding protein
MRKVLYLLGQFDDADIDWLLRHGHKERVAPGTVLIRERQPINAVYILLDGTLEVTGTGVGGGSVRLGSGEVVGEMSFLEARPPSASVAAVTLATVLAIPRADLAAKLASDSRFAARFYQALALFLSQRLRNTTRRLGYGQERHLDDNADYADELDAQVLDTIHLAGCRFDHVLQRLLGE